MSMEDNDDKHRLYLETHSQYRKSILMEQELRKLIGKYRQIRKLAASEPTEAEKSKMNRTQADYSKRISRKHEREQAVLDALEELYELKYGRKDTI